jgi:hypothetical protein
MKYYSLSTGIWLLVAVLGLLVVNYAYDQYNDVDYNCQVMTVSYDYTVLKNDEVFKSKRLDEIVDHGGAMVGVHINQLAKLDSGDYVGSMTKQNDVLAATVMCKRA